MSHRNMRRYWLAAHLYLGLFFGSLFSLSGLTGSILVFYPEIDRFINPQLVIDNSYQESYDFQPVINVLDSKFPGYRNSWRIEVPLNERQSLNARYYKPPGKEFEHFAPLMVSVDAKLLTILEVRYWGDYFVTWVYDLHYSFLIGEVGKTLVSFFAIFYSLMLCIGVYLWLPRKATVIHKIKFRLSPHFTRKIYDIHTLFGIYSIALMIVIIVTGVVLATPQWFTPFIDQVSSRYKNPEVRSSQIQGKKRISIDHAIQIAKEVIPNSGLRWVQTPDGDAGVYVIRLKQYFEPSNRFPKSMVWVDQYSGEVLAVRNPKNNSGGDTFLDWQHPLHNGEAFGLIGRVVVFLLGLIPVVLFITGIIRWRQKIKAKKLR